MNTPSRFETGNSLVRQQRIHLQGFCYGELCPSSILNEVSHRVVDRENKVGSQTTSVLLKVSRFSCCLVWVPSL